MSTRELTQRENFVGVVIVWVAAAVVALVVGVIAPPAWRSVWMLVGLGGCVLLAFGVQLWHANPRGFILRVAASLLGALAVMGLIGIGFGLSSLAVA
ncbi:hypothetical protein [Microbacterium sp.]|uniref:hypothetical protein n=1 Tax=Microbacterium sp. TaxID=51671 RepID=UPI003A8B6DB1